MFGQGISKLLIPKRSRGDAPLSADTVRHFGSRDSALTGLTTSSAAIAALGTRRSFRTYDPDVPLDGVESGHDDAGAPVFPHDGDDPHDSTGVEPRLSARKRNRSPSPDRSLSRSSCCFCLPCCSSAAIRLARAAHISRCSSASSAASSVVLATASTCGWRRPSFVDMW